VVHGLGPTAFADEVVRRLISALVPARDPDRAVEMRRYMRDQFPFLGVHAPERRRLVRAAMAGVARPDREAALSAAGRLWEQPQREYQYAAVDLLTRWVGALDPSVLPALAGLITAKAWWDTVDPLASRVVGGVVRAHPEAAAVMDGWAGDDDLWLARAAILHQLRFGVATDADRLFAMCASRAGDADLFMRKAIGWALRQYARTDPDAVRAFVAAHAVELSPLSTREALKHLGPLDG
jgi:3-methyladenine DNA glycosylase AlkD